MANRINLNGVKRDIGLMVQSLARNIHDHDRSESSVPKTIRFMLSEFPDNEDGIKYNWQCFIIPDSGEEVRSESFLDFVTENPPRGLGTTIGKLEVWVKAEMPDLLPILKDSKIPGLAEHGGEREKGQVRITNMNKQTDTADYILARLKRDNPTLAQRLIDGEVTANEAAIMSGIRKKYVSVRCDPDGFIRKIKQVFSQEEVAYIIEELNRPEIDAF